MGCALGLGLESHRHPLVTQARPASSSRGLLSAFHFRSAIHSELMLVKGLGLCLDSFLSPIQRISCLREYSNVYKQNDAVNPVYPQPAVNTYWVPTSLVSPVYCPEPQTILQQVPDKHELLYKMSLCSERNTVTVPSSHLKKNNSF